MNKLKRITTIILFTSVILFTMGLKETINDNQSEIIGIGVSRPILTQGKPMVLDIQNEVFYKLESKKVLFRKDTYDDFKEIQTPTDSCKVFDLSWRKNLINGLKGEKQNYCHGPYYKHFYVTLYFDSNIESETGHYLFTETYEIGELSYGANEPYCKLLNQLVQERKKIAELAGKR